MRTPCSKETIVLGGTATRVKVVLRDAFAIVMPHLQVVLLKLIVIAMNKLVIRVKRRS